MSCIVASVNESLRDILDPGQVFSEKYVFVQQKSSAFGKEDETDELLFDVESVVLDIGRVVSFVGAVPKVS